MNTPITINDLEQMNEAEQARRGQMVAERLKLRKNSKGRYNTTDGDKTALGLFRWLVERLASGE